MLDNSPSSPASSDLPREPSSHQHRSIYLGHGFAWGNSASRERGSVFLILLILTISTVLKLQWALSSAGSVDAILFFNFGEALNKMPLHELYAIEPKFNHTPLTGFCLRALYRVAGGEVIRFAFYLRLGSILADIAVVLGVIAVRRRLNTPPWWAIALLAASPVSIMVSGFHANLDPIMVALLFFAAVATLRDRHWLSALLFGLACNVKIVPILVSPILFFYWLRRGHGLAFAGTVGALMLLGSLPPSLQAPGTYIHNVFGYGSWWGVWGLPYLFRMTGWAPIQAVGSFGLSAEIQMISQVLKVGIIAGVTALAWRRRVIRDRALFTTFAGAWAIFFVFAPGVGVQYMVWFAPFMVFYSPRWFAAFTLLATLFLAAFYQSCSPGGFPWFLAIPRGPEQPFWSACGFPLWLAFASFLVLSARKLWTLPVQGLPTSDVS